MVKQMIYIHLLLANIIWGLNVIVTKLNYDYFHPMFLTMLKLLFSILSLMVFIYHKKIAFEKVSLKKLFLQTNFINVINFLLTYYALQFVDGAMTATINSLAPASMFLIATSFSKWNFKIFFSLCMTICGFLCAIHFRVFDIDKGILFLVIALFVYNFGNYKLKNTSHNPYTYNLYLLIIAFFEFIILLFFVKEPLFTQVNILRFWLFILTSGIGYAYIQCIYLSSIQVIGPLKTSFFMAFNPVFTYLFSLFFLKEKIDFFILVGFLIIFMASFYFISKKQN